MPQDNTPLDNPIAADPRERSGRIPTPGGRRSPQRPGMTPDRSTVPGQHSVRVAPATEVRRPLTQYGTAQEIMQVFAPGPDGVWSKEDFEQAPPSNEEVRKVHPANLTPIRPVPGLALGESLQRDDAAALEAGKQGE